MKIVYTSTFTDSFIRIPIEARDRYPQIVYAVAGQYLVPCRTWNTSVQSKRIPIQKTE